MGTAQRFGRVDKTIRELCTHVIECRRGYFGRVTKLRKYDVDDYEQFLHEVDVMKNARFRTVIISSFRRMILEMRMIASRCLQVPRENNMSHLRKSMV